jgi:hypothetical protein
VVDDAAGGRPADPDEPTREAPEPTRPVEGSATGAGPTESTPPAGAGEPGQTQPTPALGEPATPVPGAGAVPGSGEWPAPAGVDQSTRVQPAATGEPPFDPTTVPPSDPYFDDTAVTMAAHDHSYQPDDGYPGGGAPPAWSGRAGVPPPDTRPPTPNEPEWDEPERRGGAWYLPALLGLVVALLFGLVALGLWLGLRDRDKPGPSASTTPAPTVTSAAPARTSAAPSAPPTTASSALVELPDLSNVSYTDAADLLRNRGLVPKRVNEVNTSLPRDTVIRTDPGPGQVPTGSTVTVFVATAPPSPPPPPTTAPASPSTSPS